METILVFGMPGGWELLVIALLVIIFFGAKRIPEVAKGIGKGIREFKDATSTKKDVEESANPEKA